MSRKLKKKHNRKFTPPAGARITPITDAMISAMQMHNQPGANNASAFSPGAPIKPTPGITLKDGPRQFPFQIGYNIGQVPRATEATSFDTLRNLATLYDGVMLCHQVWFDLCSKLDPVIKPTEEALAAAGGDETVFADDIARYKAFFECPDPDNDLDLKSWMRMALKDQLEIDALSIYVHPNRAGGVYALEIIDGTTIKPLIDERGRKPRPPWPAYQQFWHGAPLDLYSADQMLYMRETPRADSVYGFSRIERIIMRVNQALRKQNKDLSRFTEGNLPSGILEMPPNPDNEWTPDLLMLYQQVWDGVLAGNDAIRSRVKVVEPGAKFTAVDDQDIMTPFDSFLLNTTAACHGLTMAELGFTENVNKSSGDSQEAVVYRRAMRPLMNRYAELFTLVLRKYFNETRFVFAWKGFEEAEDLGQQATAMKTLISAGIISPSTAAKMLKYPVEVEIPVFFTTATGPVFFEDLLDPQLRKAQQDAKMKGLELAQQGQEAQPGGSDQGGDQKAKSGDGGDTEGQDGGQDQKEEDDQPSDTRSWPAGPGIGMEWQDTDPDVEKTLAQLYQRGVKKIKWVAEPGACDECMKNDGQVVEIGYAFSTGAICVPGHNHCGCSVQGVE